MNKKIHTICGDIDINEIEYTLVHEHVVFNLSKTRKDTTSILGDEETLPAIYEEFERLYEYGFNTIAEQTNYGMGRNPKLLKEISERSHIHIIEGTGYYKEEYYPEEVFNESVEFLENKLTSEILDGIEGTGIKAGFYGEIGSSLNEIKPSEEKVFRAVSGSHKKTGAPISTHCELGTMGLEQRKILDVEGVQPRKVSFGHQDLNTRFDEQLELLKWGAFIQFDTIGKIAYRPDEDRLDNLLRLLDKGYEDKIMLSCDITRKTYLKAFGGHGYIYLGESFLDRMKKAGISMEIIEKLLRDNPRKFLAF